MRFGLLGRQPHRIRAALAPRCAGNERNFAF
jgi:hypothetical protein